MIVVGELINASRKRIRKAIAEADVDAIQQVARRQHERGATYIDVNAGVFEDREVELLPWLVTTVQQAVDAPCCIDSPSPQALEAALAAHQGPPPIVNSISLERDRYDAVLPLVAGAGVGVVALCMSDTGMPEETEDRLTIADTLINRLVQKDVRPEQIFVDALVQPVSTDGRYGRQYLDAVSGIRERFPEVHTICGLSNISFGLPKRKILNRAFVGLAIGRGQDAAICDPTDDRLMTAIFAAEALMGRDDYCEQYLTAFRADRLVI